MTAIILDDIDPRMLQLANANQRTDAGWWPDDNSKHVLGPDLRRDPDNGPHRVTIRIEAAT